MFELIVSVSLFHLILYLIYRPYKRGLFQIPDRMLWFYMLLMIAYGTYGNHFGDFYRYEEMIEYFGGTASNDVGISMEPQYYHLAKIVHGNPLLWRLIINSTAFLGLGFFLKKSDMNNYPTLLFFVVSCLFWAAGHRGWWGFIYFFFGVYLCFYKKNYLYLLFCAAVLYSHASHIVLLALLPIAFFKYNKYIAVAAVFVMLGSLAILQSQFDMLLVSGMDNEYASEKLASYTNQGGQNFFGDSIGEMLQNITSKIPIYLFAFYLFYQAIIHRAFRQSMSDGINALVNITYCLFLASLGLNLIDTNSGTFANRLFSMLTFPFVLISPFVLTGEKRKYYTKFIIWKWISIELTFIFSLYYTYAHGI